jgi:hypothetical protein
MKKKKSHLDFRWVLRGRLEMRGVSGSFSVSTSETVGSLFLHGAGSGAAAAAASAAAAQPRTLARLYLGGRPRLARPTSSSWNSRKSMVALHHVISLAVYAAAQKDGTLRRSVASKACWECDWKPAWRTRITCGLRRSISSDRKRMISAA